MNICVYGASSDAIDKKYIIQGEHLGEEMVKRGHNLVYGGGACGMMGAVARGVTRGGGEIVGVAPLFFKVDGVLYDKCTEFIYTETMRERKQIMEDRADAFIVTPGGIGTYEELFEILTLKQLDRHQKAIVFLNTDGYYDLVAELMQRTSDLGFMKPASLELYKFCDTVEETLDYLEGYIPPEIEIEEMKHLG